MWEILKNAWNGWFDMNSGGKVPVLFLFLLLYYSFFRKKSGKNAREEFSLAVYAAAAALLCIFPVSAAVLMKYQTKFYDYQWVWNYVPMTIVIAFCGGIFLEDRWEHCGRAGKIAVTTAALIVVLLCGNLTQPLWQIQPDEEGTYWLAEENGGQQIRDALTAVAESASESVSVSTGEPLCLWAPREIMAAARGLHPQIQLVYGRDMWDASLGAYTYETYCRDAEILYLWMDYAQKWGTLDCAWALDESFIAGADALENAKALGVNRILLPGNLQEEALAAIEEMTGVQAEVLAGYYLLVL